MNFKNRKMKHNIFSLCLSTLLAFLLVFQAQAQNSQTFNGVVVDENNEPVIGASIKVLDTNTGTITDLDGKFTVSVPANGKIEITYLGYLPQTISDFSNTRIVLKEDLMQLEDVVIVGYGVQKKAHLTGAIATLDPAEINDLSVGNLGESLKGLIPGLSVSGGNTRPGETARLAVRQADVITSFSVVSGYTPEYDPIYVIDGFITDLNAFNNLDATMIESISVLKDGAAAVYGSRAGNGVILVTTKRGKEGKPKISYTGQFGFTDEVSRPDMLNAYDYGKIWNGVRAADPKSKPWDSERDLFQADELEAMKSLNYDPLDREWSTGFTQKHGINLSGGSQNANYFAGITYYTQDGNLGDIDYERWTYRAGADVKVSNWFKASLQVSGDYAERNSAYSKVGGENPQTDYNTLLTHPRYMPEYIDGKPIARYGVTNSEVNVSQYYHYQEVQNLGNYSKSMPQNMVINSALEYDFGWSEYLKGLKVRFTYSKGISTNKGNQYATNYTLYTIPERKGHLYTGDYTEKDFEAKIIDNGNFLRRTSDRSDNYQMNFIVSYGRTFGEHTVNGLFSIEKSESEYENLDGMVTDPYSFTNGQSNTATGTHTTSFGRRESGTLSYIGRLNYAYADKYLFEFLIRSDASTKFAPENYWGVFPSVSAGWVISQEDWFKNSVSWVDHLKIRGSYGLTGRDNIKAWQWSKTYSLNDDKGPIFGTSGAGTNSGTHIGIPDESFNRNAKWDQSYKGNFGIDMNVLNGRLGFNLDGYYEWNREVFISRPGSEVPSTVGTRPAAENYGEIDAYGVELSMNWRDKIGKDFKYSIGVNTGYQDNEVNKLAWPTPIKINDIHPGGRKDVGSWGLECLGMFRSYQEIEEYFEKYNITNYLGKTKDEIHPGMLIYKDIRGEQSADGIYAGPDGKIDTENDIVRISNRSNPYGVTFNLKAEYKSISFSAQIGGSWGGYSFVPDKARSISSLTSTASGYDVMQFTNLPSFWADNMFVYKDVLDANGNVVAEANRNAKYPNLHYSLNSNTSTFWKISGTRWTLNNITFAYTLPKQFVNKLGVENCRLNLTGQNLLSFFNPYPDNFMDPLQSYGSYPTLRKFTLGVNLTF